MLLNTRWKFLKIQIKLKRDNEIPHWLKMKAIFIFFITKFYCMFSEWRQLNTVCWCTPGLTCPNSVAGEWRRYLTSRFLPSSRMRRAILCCRCYFLILNVAHKNTLSNNGDFVNAKIWEQHTWKTAAPSPCTKSYHIHAKRYWANRTDLIEEIWKNCFSTDFF